MDDIEELLSNVGDDDPELKKIINEEFDDLGNSGEEEIEINLDEDLSQSQDNMAEPVSADSEDVPETSSPEVSFEEEIVEETDEHLTSEDVAEPIPFNVPGNKSWNTKEPYILHYDEEQLIQDRLDLKNSFYFTTNPETNDTLRENIKTELLRFIRRPTENIINSYSEFIYKTISTQMDEAITRFQIDSNSKNYFIYHTGPLVVFKILDRIFRINNTGTCYKQIAVNKSQSFYPSNAIRVEILKWFEENINILSLNFDNIQKYDTIKNVINKFYEKEVKIFNQKFYKLNQKIGPEKSITKEKLLKLKGYDWYGICNIEIYKRYVDHTIFHGIL